jgi:hypothetical protein
VRAKRLLASTGRTQPAICLHSANPGNLPAAQSGFADRPSFPTSPWFPASPWFPTESLVSNRVLGVQRVFVTSAGARPFATSLLRSGSLAVPFESRAAVARGAVRRARPMMGPARGCSVSPSGRPHSVSTADGRRDSDRGCRVGWPDGQQVVRCRLVLDRIEAPVRVATWTSSQEPKALIRLFGRPDCDAYGWCGFDAIRM